MGIVPDIQLYVVVIALDLQATKTPVLNPSDRDSGVQPSRCLVQLTHYPPIHRRDSRRTHGLIQEIGEQTL